jgi:hypothetical protein
MKQRKLFLAAVFLLVTGSILRADPAMSTDQIKQLYADAKFKEVIPQINKALALKGPAAEGYDKHELLLLKGEASLHTRSKSQAVDAFKAAAAAATEPNDGDIATATAELIRQSNGSLKYQPKTKISKDDKTDPIDIVEPESRKLAFAALETDLEAALKPRVDAAVKSTKLADVATEAKDPALASLRPIEIAATGSATASKQMLGDLGQHAYALMDSPLDKLIDRVKGDVDAVNNIGKPVKPGQVYNNAASSKTAFVTEINNVADSAKVYSDYAIALEPIFGDTTDFKPVRKKVSAIEAYVKDLKRAVGG